MRKSHIVILKNCSYATYESLKSTVDINFFNLKIFCGGQI